MTAPDSLSFPENWQTLADTGWIGKEHFQSFQQLHSRLFSKTVTTVAFNACIQGGGKRVFSTEQTSYGGRRITGFEQFTPRTGLTVAERLEVGLGPYPHESREYPNLKTVCQQYAIEAYGFVATIQAEDEDWKPSSEQATRLLSDVYLSAIAGSLATYLALD